MIPAISVTQLTKRYDAVTALSDISFEVNPGEIMGFLGPNGAGKTTALRILTGMIAPTKGKAYIEGIDVTKNAIDVRRKIGYVPEVVALYPEMRVKEYLYYRAQLKHILRTKRNNRIKSVMEQCDIADVSRSLIGRLSKGYRQRVALADGLLGEPKVLILDEPTVGLDPHQIRQTRKLITHLGRTTTILLSTHILPEVEATCNRVTIINHGKIVAVDSPAQLRERLKGTRNIKVELKGEESILSQALQEIPGVAEVRTAGTEDGFYSFEIETKDNADVREAISHLASERKWALRELSTKHASLEDVFIHLTTKEA